MDMTELTTVPDFEGLDWTGGNAEKNWDGHQVSPLEAEQVFFNSPLLAGGDEAHSQHERRFFALGQTDAGRELFIAFMICGRKLRVISARDMSRRERKGYRS